MLLHFNKDNVHELKEIATKILRHDALFCLIKVPHMQKSAIYVQVSNPIT